MEGASSRLCRNFGLQRAMLISLTAYTLTAKEAVDWGLVQKIVPIEELVAEAVRRANGDETAAATALGLTRADVQARLEGATPAAAGR